MMKHPSTDMSGSDDVQVWMLYDVMQTLSDLSLSHARDSGD